jgi:SAM-dependent methyltransferase
LHVSARTDKQTDGVIGLNNDLLVRFGKQLQDLDKFPGWSAATPFLETLAAERGYRKIIDIGGGANPLIRRDFVRRNGIHYGLVDISQTELDKAPEYYTTKICIDVTSPTDTFLAKVGERNFDMAFSHMFLEHIDNPVQAHKNIRSLLKIGGLAVHLYPSPNNLPLAINRIVPEWLSTRMVKLAQPERDLRGRLGKFPAYYKLCGNRSRKLHELFEGVGYKVLVHTGFVGHEYYARVPIIRNIELMARRLLINAGIRMTSFQLLIMEKV